MRFAPCIRNPDDEMGRELIVEDDVWIGSGAIVLSVFTIGRGAVIVAGGVGVPIGFALLHYNGPSS